MSCAGINRAGEPCGSPIVGPQGFCGAHGGQDMRAIGSTGGTRSGEARRLRAMSAERLLAERIAADVDLTYRAYRAAIDKGDWDAAEATLAQAFGRPVADMVDDSNRRGYQRELLERPQRDDGPVPTYAFV